ncbi:hypothetical protein [Arthrobacter sp. NPDC056727]|uniref:hypothetical protein n=1 Tax=Arthrobacter sp. NPDC056727 TaxID=3345927 RepID=UPI0036707CE3
MHEMSAGGSMPPAAQTDPAANVQAGVTVYFPGGERNLLYVEVDGQWVEYVKSVTTPEAAGRTHTLSVTDTHACPDTGAGPVHWAGYTCHSPYEITREPRRRLYYDPRSRPDLFLAFDGQGPSLPLPVLELARDPEDPAPWLDPDTGERFSSDGASLVLKLLRYAPRKLFTAPAVW